VIADGGGLLVCLWRGEISLGHEPKQGILCYPSEGHRLEWHIEFSRKVRSTVIRATRSLICLIVCVLALAGPARAMDFFWNENGPSDLWQDYMNWRANDGSDWGESGYPQPFDTVIIDNNSYFGSGTNYVTYINPGWSAYALNNFNMSNDSTTGGMVFQQTNYYLGVNVMRLGAKGGSHLLDHRMYDGSELRVHVSLTVAAHADSNVAFRMYSGSTISGLGGLSVGSGGTGDFYQYSGSSINTGSLSLGSSGVGKYHMYGGTIDVAGDVGIGNYGTGHFTMTGGSFTARGNRVDLGGQVGGFGALELANGVSFEAGTLAWRSTMSVGERGIGSVNHHDIGTTASYGYLILGENAGAVGEYHLANGTVTAGEIRVGDGGIGRFIQNSGRVDIDYFTNGLGGKLILNEPLGTQALYDLNNGALTSKSVWINGGSKFTQSNGTHTTGHLVLADSTNPGGESVYALGGGTLTTEIVRIGEGGEGVLLQTGGRHVVTNALRIGAHSLGQGVYDMRGGVLQAVNVFVDYDGTGRFTQTGGRAELSNTMEIDPDGTAELHGGTLHAANRLTVYGTVDMVSADITADVAIRLYPASTFRGYGVINSAGTLTNDTRIEAVGGNLTFNVASIDLDGTSGGGQVDATGGSVVFNGLVSDWYDGEIEVGAGRFVNMSQPWTVSSGGKITLHGTSASNASVGGSGAMTVRGELMGHGRARVNSPVTFVSSSTLRGSTAAGSELQSFELRGPTTFVGGTYRDIPLLTQNANVTVAGDTTLTVGVYDWDGTVGAATTINAGATFTILADRIDTTTPDVDGYDGTVTVNSATLDVRTAGAWRLDGTLALNQTTAVAPRLIGSPVDVRGAINVTGQGVIDPSYTMATGAAMNVVGGGKLTLNGSGRFNGGTVGGAGTFSPQQTVLFYGDTTFNVGTLELDGGAATRFTVVNGVAVTVNSPAIASPGAGYSGDATVAGSLAINTAAPWGLDGTMTFSSGLVSGSTLVNTGLVTGYGTIDSDFQHDSATPVYGHTSKGGGMVFNGAVTGPGDYSGRVRFNGSLAPTGTTVVAGDLTLGDGAAFITNAVRATVDAIDGRGAVKIGAGVALDILIQGGGGEFRSGRYTLIDAAAGRLSGTFADVTDLGAYATVNGDGVTYDPAGGTVTLTLDLNLNPADGNLDGATDVSDRIIWNSNNFTEGTTFITGDYNGDGATDVSDRIIWNKYNFTEATSGAPILPAHVTPVPEPTALALLILGQVIVFTRRRRRR